MRSAEIVCLHCGKIKRLCPSQAKKQKYCSRECYSAALSKSMMGEGHPRWGGGRVEMVCVECGTVKLVKPCELKYRKYCSKKCYGKAISRRQCGENNHMWRGGITNHRDKEFNSPEYKEWKAGVLRRDDFTCLMCGRRSGGGNGAITLNAHHIKNWVNYPELRLDPNNGLTLCRNCHIEVHRGPGAKPKKMMNEQQGVEVNMMTNTDKVRAYIQNMDVGL